MSDFLSVLGGTQALIRRNIQGRMAVFFGCMILCLCAFFATASPSSEQTLDYQRGMLTLNLERIKTSQLLKMVADAAQFELIIVGILEERVQSWPLADYKLHIALKSMTAPNGLVIVWRPREDGIVDKEIAKLVVVGHANTRPLDTRTAADPFDPSVAEQTLSVPLVQEKETKAEASLIVSRELTAGYRLLTDSALSPDLSWSVKQLVSNQDIDSRIEAVRYLATYREVDALGIGLGDRDSLVRREVVAALAAIGTAGAIQLLGQVLLGDKDAQLRRAAVGALSEIGQGQLTTIFLQQALNDKSTFVRSAAQAALRD